MAGSIDPLIEELAVEAGTSIAEIPTAAEVIQRVHRRDAAMVGARDRSGGLRPIASESRQHPQIRVHKSKGE